MEHPRFLQQLAESQLLHLGFCLFPTVLAKLRVLRGEIKGVSQGAVGLLFTNNRGAASNDRSGRKNNALFSSVQQVHYIASHFFPYYARFAADYASRRDASTETSACILRESGVK